MSGEPIFDPKTMSDDELYSRSHDLMKKMHWAQRYAGAGQGLQQMAQMLARIEDERRERVFMDHWALIKPYVSEPIETDPTLRDAERAIRAAREQAKPQASERPRPRMQARRPFPIPTAHGFGAPLRPTAAPVIPTIPPGRAAVPSHSATSGPAISDQACSEPPPTSGAASDQPLAGPSSDDP